MQAQFQNISRNIIHKAGRNKRVRQKLPGGGKISIDKAVPFLLIYRMKEDGDVKREFVKLMLAEVCYLILPSGAEYLDFYKKLIEDLIAWGTENFGAFLVLEIWQGPTGSNSFKIKGPDGPAHSTVETLARELGELKHDLREEKVEYEKTSQRHPPGSPPLLKVNHLKDLGGLLLGLEIPTIFRNKETGKLYPVFFRALRKNISEVLRKALFDFVRVQTTADIGSYQMLGRRFIDDAVWHIDKKLAQIEQSYQFLLLLSPVNADSEWEIFKKNGFKKLPKFTYRLLPVDPDVLKRELYNLNLNKINDPALAFLFRDKRNELDIQITMLAEREGHNFLHNSMRLYKGVDAHLHNVALGLLNTLAVAKEEKKEDEKIDAEEFAARAQQEFDYYKKIYSGFNAHIEVRDDISGLMVSQGNLYIPKKRKIRKKRVDALLHHEVGTHVLTYYNGTAQPLKQLYCGLADYDELQEGLAVLAEYLVDGLDRSRMRLLAARVVAAHALVEGADFIETFNLLRGHKMKDAESWYITTRIFQAGGFIKDIIYLRGLLHLVDHLKNGGDLETLFIGKIAGKHISLIQELLQRGMLNKIPMMPRYLQSEKAQHRLQKVRNGTMLHNLISN